MDQGLYKWAKFVEQRMDEAEMAVRQTQVGRSGNAIAFVHSARVVAFNRLMGLSTASAYRQPQLPGKVMDKPKAKAHKRFSGEGEIDLRKFNG